MKPAAPLIIIGMHRSGTTLVVELLKKLGFFAGARLERNLEPPFFIIRNEWLMRRLGGSWDNPSAARALRLVPRYRDEAVYLMKREADSFGFRQYRGGLELNTPWGWKDPRNTFTAPVWCEVFPGASVLHVVRNGIDVARSLLAREQGRLQSGHHRLLSPRSLKSRAADAVRRFERYRMDSARCLVLDEGFLLWEEYVAEADAFLDSFNGRKSTIRYEDLLNNPVAHIEAVARFAGLPCNTQSLRSAAEGIRPERAFAFKHDGASDAFVQMALKSRLMSKYGYSMNADGGIK